MSFICPITQERFVDPVICSDGQTYERAAIMEWFSRGKRTSPVTNARLTNTVLIPNHALKSLIEPVPAIPTSPTILAHLTAQEEKEKTPWPPETSLKYIREPGDELHPKALLQISCVNPTPMPLCLVAIVDVSGSMGASLSRSRSAARDSPISMFSRVEIIRMALRIVISTMTDRDHFVLVPFSSGPHPMFSMPTTTSGKAILHHAVDSLTPRGGTDLHKGVLSGLKEALQLAAVGINTQVIVFTDGESTDNVHKTQYRNDIEHLTMQNRRHSRITLSVCGFGADINDEFLGEIAEAGNGFFSYIPDGSMVCTVFANMIANMLTTGISDFKVDEDYVRVPCDAPRNIWVSSPAHAPLPLDEGEKAVLEFQNKRASFVHLLGRLLESNGKVDAVSLDLINSLVMFNVAYVDDISGNRDPDDPNKGQISKACNAWWTWGRKYIRSILSAHKREECANFKDATMTFYHSPMFCEVRDRCERLFLEMPVPTPSNAPPGTQVSRLAFSDTFMSQDAVCFSGCSIVALADRGHCRIDHLVRGDTLAGGAKVVLVLVTESTGPSMISTIKACEDCCVTPSHPVKGNDGKWAFPVDLKPLDNPRTGMPRSHHVMRSFSKVYNLVLDSGHTILVGGFVDRKYLEFCTLGHGFEDDEVVSHPFFGNMEAVMGALSKLKGFDEGKVVIMGVTRSSETGLVTGFLQR